MARRAKRAGLKVLLNLHYSDFWADPAHQTTPAAWQGQDLATLAGTVHDYTRASSRASPGGARRSTWCRSATRSPPACCGPRVRSTGRTVPTSRSSARCSRPASPAPGRRPRRHRPEVMVHIDRGGDNGGSRWFYDHIAEQGVEFDVIGLSYYGMWHGDLSALEGNLTDLAARYGKPLVVVETAYPWTVDNGDQLENFVTSAGQLPDADRFPPTPAGQAAYFEALRGNAGGGAGRPRGRVRRLVAGVDTRRRLGSGRGQPQRQPHDVRLVGQRPAVAGRIPAHRDPRPLTPAATPPGDGPDRREGVAP